MNTEPNQLVQTMPVSAPSSREVSLARTVSVRHVRRGSFGKEKTHLHVYLDEMIGISAQRIGLPVLALFIMKCSAVAAPLSTGESLKVWTGEFLSVAEPVSPWRTDVVLDRLRLRVGASTREDVAQSISSLPCIHADRGAFVRKTSRGFALAIWVADTEQIQIHSIYFEFDEAGLLVPMRGFRQLGPIEMKSQMVPNQRVEATSGTRPEI